MKILKSNKGLTIIELLVVMAVMGILLTMATYLFVNFLSQNIAQESVATSHSDVQSVLDQIKWDILMTGYSISKDQTAVEADNAAGTDDSDELLLRSLWFGIEDGGHWSYVLDPVRNSNIISIRNWNDEEIDIKVDDKVIFLTSTKQKLEDRVYTVVSRDTLSHAGGIPGYTITLDSPISTSMNFIFSITGVNEVDEVKYHLDGTTLMRDSLPMLDNVLDFQVAFWIDENENLVQESSEWYNDLNVVNTDISLADNIRLIRLNILTGVKGEDGYVATNTYVLEDNVTTPESNLRTVPWTSLANPRNIR